ncbi:MAG TPA: SDR family NAD(P)-dependent oxidoreductase [Burkholderiales bacterium]|nr:SDR family NAD(P)-dependent oxidoreductase [Burkholderiales bacterium]
MAAAGKLSGATTIVTGASAGIGEAVAKTFAREGAQVAIVSTNLPEAKRVAGEIEAAGGAVLVLTTDVTQSDEVDATVAAVLRRWGTIDILVNAVGGWKELAPLADIADDEWHGIIALNLTSAFFCARAVSRSMIEKKKGRIINFASQSASAPNPATNSSLPYACAKAGVLALTKHLARQLGPYGITVNTISPGTTLTPRVRNVWDAATIEKKAAANPLRCLVEPQDSANAALFLASDEARHITGVNLNVNAGSQMI